MPFQFGIDIDIFPVFRDEFINAGLHLQPTSPTTTTITTTSINRADVSEMTQQQVSQTSSTYGLSPAVEACIYTLSTTSRHPCFGQLPPSILIPSRIKFKNNVSELPIWKQLECSSWNYIHWAFWQVSFCTYTSSKICLTLYRWMQYSIPTIRLWSRPTVPVPSSLTLILPSSFLRIWHLKWTLIISYRWFFLTPSQVHEK